MRSHAGNQENAGSDLSRALTDLRRVWPRSPQATPGAWRRAETELRRRYRRQDSKRRHDWLRAIVHVAAAYAATEKWRSSGGQFVPAPDRWIRDEAYLAGLPPALNGYDGIAPHQEQQLRDRIRQALASSNGAVILLAASVLAAQPSHVPARPDHVPAPVVPSLVAAKIPADWNGGV